MDMRDLFGCQAVLFEGDQDGERVCVECALTEQEGLVMMQEIDGPLAAWCFGETPHRMEIELEPLAAASLAAILGLDAVAQLPGVLRMRFTGYDCAQRVQDLMRGLGIPYRMIEQVPVR